MLEQTFYHLLPDGTQIKFSVFSEIIRRRRYYFARLVDTGLDTYQRLSDQEKDNYHGMKMSQGRGKTIYYSNIDRLITDIQLHYGTDTILQSEV